MMDARDVFGADGLEARGLFHYTLDFWSESLNGVSEDENDPDDDNDSSFLADMCNFLTKERYVICARFMGSSARFINHSCSPNAGAERWLDSSEQLKIAIVASNLIHAGDEVTIDYAWNNESMTCHCGSAGCRGHL